MAHKYGNPGMKKGSHMMKSGKRMMNNYHGQGNYDGMIHQDHSKIANMPQEVIMKEYPTPPYNNYYLDDTARGIDRQISDDMREKKREMYPEKY